MASDSDVNRLVKIVIVANQKASDHAPLAMQEVSVI